jgi:hypothetical protein
MADKTLFEFAFEVPHFDGFVRRTTHEKVLLSGETQFENGTRMSLHCFVLAISD